MANPVSITRAAVGQTTAPTGPGLIPIEYSNDIIQKATASSVALSTFRTVRMPTGITTLPVLGALPNVSFVNESPLTGAGSNDTKKPATNQVWSGLNLVAEELAAIVVIPEAVLEDATIDLWSEITPRLGEAIAAKVDETVFFGGIAGHSKPASFPDGIVKAAAAKGAEFKTGDFLADVNHAFGAVENSGYDVTDVYATRGIKSTLRGAVDLQGRPVYLESFRGDGQADQVYGASIRYSRAWDSGKALAVVGDPSMAILGIRSDMQTKVLDQATLDISAARDGSEMVSLAQQDLVALRVRFRFAFNVAVPVSIEDPTGIGYPFAVVGPKVTTTK